MNLPQINKIKADICNLSIYIRSTKKWGKTTLFRDTILEKFGDPSYGLLVKCGYENGDKMLDEINSLSIMSYADLVDLKAYLIDKVLIERDEKGKIINKVPIEHNIKIVAFDTADELVPIAEGQIIKMSKKENPTKPCKSIKGAFGGYGEGEKMAANKILKPFMYELQDAGFGVWAIAHTKFKQIKEKGGLDEEGYMQLTSNLAVNYESAFGDIFDVTLTGVIDREYDEIQDGDKTKRYAKDTRRLLYFRGTTLIDAGGRFTDGSVPEYMEFKENENNAAEFIRIIEEGMEKSKLSNAKKLNKPKPASKPVIEDKPKPAPKKVEVVVEDDDLFESDVDEFDDEFEINEPTEEVVEAQKEPTLREQVRDLYKDCADRKIKAEVTKIIKEVGSLKDCDDEIILELYEKLS